MNNFLLSRSISFFLLLLLFYIPIAVSATTQEPKMPYADYYSLATRSVNVSPSLWNQYEKEIYQNLLKKIEGDILVVPAQVQQYALDKAARDLMTFSFVDYLQAITKKRIIDPTLVSRALGEWNRTYSTDEVYRLAEVMNIKQIIWLYVGHEQKMEFNITVQVQNKTIDGPISSITPRSSKNWLANVFSDTSLPYEKFLGLIPEIAQFVGYKADTLPAITKYPEYKNGSIAVDPKFFTSSVITDSLEQAFAYQMLAALTPVSQMRLREELFAKSLIPLSLVSPQSRDYALLKARAYFHLHRRPAALAVLEKPVTAAEKSLHFLMMGDYLSLKESISGITQPTKRMLALIEYMDLHWSYQQPGFSKDEVEELVNLNGISPWKNLLLIRIFEQQVWRMDSNLGLKRQLDEVFPINGLTAINIMSETFALDPTIHGGDDLELSAYSHVREILTNHSKMVCCRVKHFQPNAMDYLWLVSAIADHNIFKALSFLLYVQGSADKAELVLNRFRRTYAGHPLFFFYESQINMSLVKKAREPMRTRLIKQAVDQASNAYYWAYGQTPEAKKSADFLLGNQTVYPVYHADFPRRNFWFIDQMASDRSFEGSETAMLDNLMVQLDYTAFDFSLFVKIVKAMEQTGWDEEQINEFFQQRVKRFNGHPEKAVYTALRYISQNEIEQAKTILSADIENNPAGWGSYNHLGDLYLRENKPQKAVEIFNKYPYFSDFKNINKVGLANDAGSAVQLLFLRGYYQEAMPFMKIGTELHTGSAMNLTSDYYLSLYQNNFAQSIALSRRLYTRYNSSTSLETYLKWLHAYGYSDMAFSIFQSISGKKKKIVPWSSAAMGLRMDNSTNETIISWLDSTASSPSIPKALFIFDSLIVDAHPPENIQTLIDQANEAENAYVHENGKVFIKLGDRNYNLFVGPDSYDANDQRKIDSNTTIPSTLGSFAHAYALLVNEKYDQALIAFKQRTKYFSNTHPYFRYALPYFIWSHIKSGQQEEILAYLDALPQKDVYVKFSKALLFAVTGKQDQALPLIDEFAYSLESPKFTPFSYWYILVELMEWVYEETDNRAYADIALKWAKHQQVLEPFTAWPYAIEAKLAKDSKQRLYALGIALYLDPTSRRVSQFNSKTKRYAEKYIELKNPFTTKKPGKEDFAI